MVAKNTRRRLREIICTRSFLPLADARIFEGLGWG